MQNGTSVKVIAAPSAAITASGNGSAVDVGDYQGLCLIALNAVGTAGTTTVSLQHSADGSNDWTDVANTGFTAVGVATSEQTIKFNADRFKKFVRAKYVSAGSGSAICAISLVGMKQYSA